MSGITQSTINTDESFDTSVSIISHLARRWIMRRLRTNWGFRKFCGDQVDRIKSGKYKKRRHTVVIDHAPAFIFGDYIHTRSVFMSAKYSDMSLASLGLSVQQVLTLWAAQKRYASVVPYGQTKVDLQKNDTFSKRILTEEPKFVQKRKDTEK